MPPRKKPIFDGPYGKTDNRQPSVEEIDAAIDLLKDQGYRIMSPVIITKYKEV
jgi:hypothetical protein